jgi:prepilin-type processing-associated H-X9-DG protein
MRSLVRKFLAAVPLAALAAAVLLAPTPQPVRAADGDLPADLALVPGDAAGFVHLRVADIWKHDMMRTLRDTVQSAGVKALTAFEKQVYPSPATIDRATVILLPPKDDREPPTVVGVIRFTEPVDRAKLVKLYIPNAITAKANGKTLYADKETEVGLHFADDKHLVIGPAQMVEGFLARPPVLRGGITPAVEAAAKGTAVVAAVNVRALPIPPQAFEQVPDNIRPLLKADRITMTMDLKDASPVLAIRANYAGEKMVAEAEEALKDAVKIAKVLMTQPKQQFEQTLYAKQDEGPRPLKELPDIFGSLAGLGAINQANQILDNLPIKRDGNDLMVSVTVPKEFNQFAGIYPVALGLMLPAVQKVREAAGRAKGQNNLKQLGLAMHNYHDVNGKMATNIYDKNGKPLLSWRVHLLPYIEQEALYRQFKLDEPWDSDNNKKLLAQMPEVFKVPNAKAMEAGKTFYQGFTCAKGTAPRAFFIDDPAARTTFANITDGTSNSLMVVEAADAVEWTKPADLVYDPKKDLPKLGGHSAGGFNVLMGDGSVRFVRDTIDKMVLKAMITIDGGEVANID